jgi:hypothetical protein
MAPLDRCLAVRAIINEALAGVGWLNVAGTKDEQPGAAVQGSLYETDDGCQIIVTISAVLPGDDEAPAPGGGGA